VRTLQTGLTGLAGRSGPGPPGPSAVCQPDPNDMDVRSLSF
jgi:hypothetical protein